MCLTNITVSQLDRDSSAVRFPKLPPEERKRLQEVIWQSARVSSLDDRRTAFRIVYQVAQYPLRHQETPWPTGQQQHRLLINVGERRYGTEGNQVVCR
jgi:hypothetical protein